jgi:hypothetical protein
MNLKHFPLVAVAAMTIAFVVSGPAAGRPLTKSPIVTGTPDLVQRWLDRQISAQNADFRYAQPVARQTAATPDLVERYVQRQPAASFYTPEALKAYGLRMQAMARTYESVGAKTTSNGFDISDALIGGAGGLGIAIFAAGLLVAARSRRPQVAV